MIVAAKEANHEAEAASSSPPSAGTSSASPPARLSGAMLAGALSALEECSDALAIYRRALDKRSPAAPRTTTTMHYQQPRALLTRIDIDFRVPEVRSMKLKNMSQSAFDMAREELEFEKLKQDSKWLEELLNSTKESLVLEGNLNVLIDEVTRELATRAQEDELLTRAQELKEKFDQMRRNVAEEREKHRKEEEQLRAELVRLRNEKERLKVLSSAESNYVDAWLDSKQEQQKLRAELTRRRLTDGLRRCEMLEKNERLVSRELEAFFRQSIEKNEKATRDWRERRLTETKQYEREIHKLREEIEKKRSELDELRREYDSRQEFIDNCLAEKEAERRRLELEEHRRSRAVKIQAWWRGVMVRRKLGPYRPEEKRRKRAGKTKK